MKRDHFQLINQKSLSGFDETPDNYNIMHTPKTMKLNSVEREQRLLRRENNLLRHEVDDAHHEVEEAHHEVEEAHHELDETRHHQHELDDVIVHDDDNNDDDDDDALIAPYFPDGGDDNVSDDSHDDSSPSHRSDETCTLLVPQNDQGNNLHLSMVTSRGGRNGSWGAEDNYDGGMSNRPITSTISTQTIGGLPLSTIPVDVNRDDIQCGKAVNKEKSFKMKYMLYCIMFVISLSIGAALEKIIFLRHNTVVVGVDHAMGGDYHQAATTTSSTSSKKKLHVVQKLQFEVPHEFEGQVYYPCADTITGMSYFSFVCPSTIEEEAPKVGSIRA